MRKLEQHAFLPPDDRQAVLDLSYTLRSLEPHAYSVREGEPPTSCVVLLAGFAFRQKLTGDGTRQIVSLHVPGDPLDLQHLFLNEADHNIQALTRAEIAIVPRSELQKLVRSRAAVCEAVQIIMLIESAISREWVLNIGRRESRARLAHLLCEFAIRLEAQGLTSDYGYELPMTQEQLADALGLTPVHVNRTLRSLQADGLITRNKRNVAFPDWERLREVADFNERYLHLDRQNKFVG